MIKLSAFADEASSSLEGQIKALNENNIPYLEVRGINGKSVAGFTAEEAKEYQKQLSDNGITVLGLSSVALKSLPKSSMIADNLFMSESA